MRVLSASSLLLTLVAGWTFGANRKDNLFASGKTPSALLDPLSSSSL